MEISMKQKEMPISEQTDSMAQNLAKELMNGFDCEQQRSILITVGKIIEGEYLRKIEDAEKILIGLKEQLDSFTGANLKSS